MIRDVDDRHLAAGVGVEIVEELHGGMKMEITGVPRFHLLVEVAHQAIEGAGVICPCWTTGRYSGIRQHARRTCTPGRDQHQHEYQAHRKASGTDKGERAWYFWQDTYSFSCIGSVTKKMFSGSYPHHPVHVHPAGSGYRPFCRGGSNSAKWQGNAIFKHRAIELLIYYSVYG